MTELEKTLTILLKEAIRIIHCHARNDAKDFLNRAREVLRKEQNKREGLDSTPKVKMKSRDITATWTPDA